MTMTTTMMITMTMTMMVLMLMDRFGWWVNKIIDLGGEDNKGITQLESDWCQAFPHTALIKQKIESQQKKNIFCSQFRNVQEW